MIPILFQNESLVVVDKPSAVLTVPPRDREDFRPCLGRDLQEQMGVQIYPVHRLDFEVSGLVIFAKTAAAHRMAQRWFEEALVDRLYQAVSRPGPQAPVPEWREWRSRLVRGKRRSFVADHGKPSITRARIVSVTADSWHWELLAVTGRPHQLRVEMYNHGHSILGDTLYSGEPGIHANKIALRAVSLVFTRVENPLGLPEVVRASDLQWP
jgi:tRNA pseudouridine32 synthase/23S rRNA pseudouridine746 synthase